MFFDGIFTITNSGDAMPQQGTKRRGRPPKPTEERKRGYLAFRARDRLRDTIRQAADREGRSISEEIEHRLERTFQEELLLGDSVHVRLICQNVSNSLRTLEMVTGLRAFGPNADRWMHQQVENAFADWLDCTRPKGEFRAPAGTAALASDPHDIAAVFLGFVDELNRGLLTYDPETSPMPAVARVRDLYRDIIRIFSEGDQK
jgi:hypothetical protein